MVARGERFTHRHGHPGHETGEQDGALHLRAGHLGVPVHAVQHRTIHDHGQAVAALAVHAGTHRLQWADDAPHRAAAEALVSHETGGEWTGRGHAGHEACRGAAVAAVEIARRRAQAGRAHAGDGNARPERGHVHSQGAEYRRRGAHVVRIEDAPHERRAGSEGGQDERAVRDRLVARDADTPANVHGWRWPITGATLRAPWRDRSSRRGTSRSSAPGARARGRPPTLP